jgi:hypothetical protein
LEQVRFQKPEHDLYERSDKVTNTLPLDIDKDAARTKLLFFEDGHDECHRTRRSIHSRLNGAKSRFVTESFCGDPIVYNLSILKFK